MDAVILLLSDARGVYIPRDFATECEPLEWGIDNDTVKILEAGPEHEQYWDAWDAVLDCAEREVDGNRYRLLQDGDLWAYCVERMTLEEQKNLLQPFSVDEFYVPEGWALYEIGNHFLCPIVYGDCDDLSETEIRELGAFLDREGGDYGDSIEWDGFGECEITGLRGATSLVLLRKAP